MIDHSILQQSSLPDSVSWRVYRIAASHLFSAADDMLQSAFVLGSGSSVPDGDGGSEDRLNDGGVKLHHH